VDEIIKPNITLFAPDDTAFENVLMNSSSVLTTLLNYQTASRFYAFQDLMSLRAGDRIPTVTPGISILVVTVNGLNYRLDDAFVVAPDLYTNGTVVVAVHGVSAIFSTRQYSDTGTGTSASSYRRRRCSSSSRTCFDFPDDSPRHSSFFFINSRH
jgi:hypothetical protein